MFSNIGSSDKYSGNFSSKYKVRISFKIGFYVRYIVVCGVRVMVQYIVFGPGFKLTSRLVQEIVTCVLMEHNVKLT